MAGPHRVCWVTILDLRSKSDYLKAKSLNNSTSRVTKAREDATVDCIASISVSVDGYYTNYKGNYSPPGGMLLNL